MTYLSDGHGGIRPVKIVPVVEVEETPEPTEDEWSELLKAIVSEQAFADFLAARDAAVAGSEAQKIADWLRIPDWFGVNDGLASEVERVFVKGEKP